MRYQILAPLDGSPQSETVFPFLNLLKSKVNIQVQLIRCYEPVSTIYLLPPDLLSLDTYTVLNETIPASMSDYLEAKRAELGTVVSRTHVKCGPAAEQILEASLAQDIDFVVMASHGRRGLDRWLLGGVTTKVLRASSKPVLVVAGENTREPRLKSILVAVDGSECSHRAFQKARDLATDMGAVLILYQAVRMSWSGDDPEPEMKKAQDHLESLAAECPGIVTRVRVYPTDGAPYIVERAEELRADLIVMGSHGRQGLQHVFMGSVAEHAVHHARCPIMVVH